MPQFDIDEYHGMKTAISAFKGTAHLKQHSY